MEFTEIEVNVIETYLVSTLNSGAVSRVTREEVFNSLHDNVGKSLNKGQFLTALGSLIKSGRIPGVIISKGRTGGIKLGTAKTEVEATPESEASNDSESL